jgi:glycosidase
MLDFVPNHTALDHPWVEDHPDYFVTGTELDLARAPQKRFGGSVRSWWLLAADRTCCH